MIFPKLLMSWEALDCVVGVGFDKTGRGGVSLAGDSSSSHERRLWKRAVVVMS